MNIFWWNPYKQTVRIPSAKVTVPGIKSLEEAKRFVETENLDNFRYIVKSRTGKNYPFKDVIDAKDFAQNKSTKSVCYTVWNDGAPVVSFLNKKPLTKWETVFTKLEECKPNRNEWYYKVPKGEFLKTMWHYATTVDIAQDKVRVREIHIEWIKCENGHLSTKYHNKSTIFHKDGSVYLHDGNIHHISADRLGVPRDPDVLSALKKELIKLRPELRKIINETGGFDLCGVFSRPTKYYCFDTFHKKAWKRSDESIFNGLYFGYFPKEIVDESQIVNTVAKRMRVPVTKSLKKAYSENMMNMAVVHFLKNLGFKDTNSYMKLIGFGIYFCRHNPSNYNEFTKKLIELRGENLVVKMLADSEFSLIRDAARSYPTINEEVVVAIMKNAKNIEEIHETFNSQTATSSGRKCIYREIEYSNKEKAKFNYVCKDGVTFELAKSNQDLAVVGMSMGICVGGYGNEAVAKHTTIIKMMKDDKYIACIEFKYGRIQQIKAKFNNALQMAYKPDIDEWLANGNIKCDCDDYRRIGTEWDRHYNYANVNPDNFIRERRNPVLQIAKCKHTRYDHNNKWLAKDHCVEDRIQEHYRYISKLNEQYFAELYERRLQEHVEFEAIETEQLPF